MNYDKINQLNEELAKLQTLTEKLNHWKNNYYDNGAEWLRNYFEFKTKEENGTGYNDVLKGELMLPIDGNKLIIELHDPSFEVPEPKRIEFYRWMLYFLAKELFDYRIKPALMSLSASPLGEEKLTGRLNKIKVIRDKAKKDLKQGLIDIRFVEKPTREQLYLWYADDLYSRVEIPIHNIENTHVSNVCEHHFVYPFLKSFLKDNSSDDPGKIIFIESFRFNFIALAEELKIRGYFDEENKGKFISWCNGANNVSPIAIDKPMNHFASVIASLVENKVISNSKKECYSLIQNDFLFNGNNAEINSIENAMKRNNTNRITEFDKINFIDVLPYLKKS